MFSKKLHADVKKSTQKIQDVKKESPTRFKHLRIILENVDNEEAKTFFDTNFSHIYYIFYDNFIITEANLKQKVHKAHREELEAVLFTLDKILTLCPELLSRRWQLHSLTRIITKLLHPGNSWKLRREAIRFFLLWYQALGDNSPDSVHAMFATLVPGFPSPFTGHPGLSCLSSLSSAAVFHDVTQGPISPAEIQPVFLPQGGEKLPDDPMKFFLDALLEFMVTQVPRIEWRDKIYKQHRCFMFLFDRFKMYYLPHMFPTFSTATSLYKPVLDLTLLRPRFGSEERKRVEPFINCRVAFIKWIANFTHSSKKDQAIQPVARSASITPSESEGERSPNSELRRVSVGANMTPGSSSTTTIEDSSSLTPFMPHSDHYLSEDPNITAINIVRDVLYGSRENVNMIHEVYRQAFLLNFTYSPAIRRAITVYKDWIQMNVPELPPFMLEPLDSHRSSGPSSAEYSSIESPDESARQTRLRNDSYIGAISKENLMVRAGLQNVLQVFISHAANVFLLEIGHEFPVLLEEQVDTCKRVLNIYRYMVMHTHMEARTWEQLLLVLLQITSLILSKTPPKRKEDTLGGKLAPAIFQTLIVTWIKANLNVVISAELWDQFLAVLSSLTQWEELIREWAKTLDTLTRVLARHVYSLDLNDLPLDRLSEQKSKRQRRSGSGPRSVTSNCGGQQRDADHATHTDKHTTDSVTDSGPTVTLKSCESWPVLRRSASESTISWARRRRSYRRPHQTHQQSGTTHIPVLSSGVEQEVARIISGARPRQKLNGKSRSMDSILHLTGDGSGYFDGELSRSPSPAPSSGVESNSFKESPMQIDMLSSDGTNVDMTDGDRRSVMSGGSVRGWLPDVAVVLWRRMLGALGDINAIRDPNLHAQVFQYLVELVETLAKIKLNQGVPGDNQATPSLPELVPPITLVAPWCFQALTLPDAFNRGKLFAYRLLCNIVLSSHDVPLPPGLLTQFYRVIHLALTSGDQNTVNTVVRYCGPRLFSLQLPGFSLLLLDFIHACNAVICCTDLRTTPRTEAMSILGSFLSFPPVLFQMPMLQPTAKDFTARSAPDGKEHVVKILLRSGKTESAGVARCIALSSLGIFVHQQLSQVNSAPVHPKIKEAINTLLLALRFNHKTVAQVASDVLLLLADHSQVLLKHFPEIPPRIVEVLASTLSHLMPVGDSDKRLLTSLVFCLGEWTMRLPSHTLLSIKNNSCLLHSIFKVLTELSEGGRCRGGSVIGGSFHPDLVQEFNPNIQLDNLKQDDSVVTMGRRTFTNSPPHLNSPAHSIQLAAKMVVMHVLNHLGHFPLAIGAARLCSLVVEQDDVPGLTADQLSAQVFSAPNIQLFMLSTNLLMSLVELPALEVPGGGVTAGLVTAASQVRIILRDLAGKASWDASILYCTPEQLKLSDEDLVEEKWSSERTSEEAMLNSCIVVSVPQHTLRHRAPSVMPTYDNSADDLDNLDDLLQYIGQTSPECLESLDTPRNIPAPPLNPELEQEAMGSVVSQRFLEQDYMTRSANLAMMQAQRCKRMESQPPQSPFQYCRLLFSQLGLAGWERRSQLHLLEKSEKLLRELRNLDTQRCRETHKIAVIYVAPGQEDKNSILSNTGGSQAYEDFIAALAWEVELESHTGFMGGLQRNKTTGSTAPYYATSFTEVIFHVSTRMPSSNHEALLQKTRHLGNDEVHIVWSEHSRDYRRGIIPTEFCDVLIVIYPRPHRLFRVQVSRKPEVPYFGPLFHEVVVSEQSLAGLVRASAISASRAKRSVIPFHQQYYEERSRSLETVMRNHKNSTTFEEFAAQVYSPIQSPSPFCPGPTRASGVSSRSVEQQIPPTNSSNLAAALIDSHPRVPPESHRVKGSEGVKVWFVGGDGDHLHQHGISPRPLKKLVLKSGAKRNPLTPPDSPTSRRSK